MIKTKEVKSVDIINSYLDKGWTLIRIKEISESPNAKMEIVITKDDEENKTE